MDFPPLSPFWKYVAPQFSPQQEKPLADFTPIS